MSRVDASAASDHDVAAVREEVSAFLGRLTRDWVPPGDAARGETSSVVAAREDPAEDPSRDAPRPGPSAPPIHDTSANYLHRAAVDEEVRSVLDAMRRATIDLSPAASRAMRAEARRNDDGTVDGHDFDPDAPEPYVADGVLPPWYAKSYYKVVAVRDDSAHVSVYDGVTRYEVGTTVCHPAAPDHGGGLYVSPTVEGCLRRDRDLFPPASALLDAPRAIAKVRCWNPDRADDPVFYGRKMAFTCCHVDEILPYPTTWGWRGGAEPEEEEVVFATGTGTRTGTGTLTGTGTGTGTEGFPSQSPSPSRRGTRSLPATPARVVGLDPGSGSGSGSGFLTPAARAPRGGGDKNVSSPFPPSGRDAERLERRSDALVRAQAATIALEEDVRDMERRLERARFGAGGSVARRRGGIRASG
jgi:hypothetical protein